MAVNKVKKNEILEMLKTVIKDAKSISFTSNNGLTVKEISDMRNKLREVNSSLTIAKKTLIKLAFKEVYNVEINDDIMVGQISVLCSNDDAIAGMTVLNSFVKDKEFKDKIVWTGSYFEGEIKNADETSLIASMPSRETLLGRLVGSMMSPVASLARFFDAASKDLEEKGKTKVGELEGKKEGKTEEKVETAE